MAFRHRQSAEANRKLAREGTTALACSQKALAVALNGGCDSGKHPLKPLAVSVQTAATLLGVGTTTVWSLIAMGRVEVIRIGRRTLPTVASLERFVSETAVSARPVQRDAP
jgi:excisionase family DNA binding protein